MEQPLQQGEVNSAELDPEVANISILIRWIGELQKEHGFTASAIARILHVDESWVGLVLRKSETEGKIGGQK